jgi:exodeoxyribonuclease III
VRIASWNVNSIRSRADHVARWLDRHQPDVVALQETKCTEAAFPAEVFTRRGYEVVHHGHDHWNGVAVASRVGLADVQTGFPGTQRPPFDEARLVTATCGDVRVSSVYVPNGRELDDPHYLFKLVWLERLRGFAAAELDAGAPLVLVGDFNVAPTDLDIYDPVRWRRRTHASPPERAAIAALADLGLCDPHRHRDPSPGLFTWWSYRPGMFEANRGLRIDLALVAPAVSSRVLGAWVDREARAESQPSDHAPVVLDLADR